MDELNALNLKGVQLYSAWHLNLNYSSIEETTRSRVIDECYWPLLGIVESSRCPQGVEISGSSLKLIEKLDPSWLEKFRELQSYGLVELIASGFEQIVGPLAPAKVNWMNLAHGNEVIGELVGATPRLAFVNEQCASRGILNLLQDFGFNGVIVEWENAWIANPSWSREIGWTPQRFLTPTGIAIVWNHSRWFQGLQRYAHDEIEIGHLRNIYAQAEDTFEGAFCFYGGDAETFDFRPGRFETEARQVGGEWTRVRDAIQTTIDAGAQWTLPSKLTGAERSKGINPFTFENQVLTKKQPKYNAVRWAVAGRANYKLNNYAHARLREPGSSLVDLSKFEIEELLPLWASDLRTHITDRRWSQLLKQNPGILSSKANRSGPTTVQNRQHARALTQSPIVLKNDQLSLTINSHKGFTVESAVLNCGCSIPLIGRVPYGTLRGPLHSPDWFTGNFVHSPLGDTQDSDISHKVAEYWTSSNDLWCAAEITTRNLIVMKSIELDLGSAEYRSTFDFDWRSAPSGSLRAGFMTFNPAAWFWENAHFESHDGGPDPNSYKVTQTSFDHGAPASHSVSATNLAGMTEGTFAIQDGRHKVSVNLDHPSRGAALMLALTGADPSPLLRTFFSLQEIDDTFRESRPTKLSLSYTTSLQCLAKNTE